MKKKIKFLIYCVGYLSSYSNCYLFLYRLNQTSIDYRVNDKELNNFFYYIEHSVNYKMYKNVYIPKSFE